MQVGIDLGTTWTAAAIHRDGRVEIVVLGERGAAIPTVVFVRGDGTVLVGDAANRRALSDPTRVAREFIRRLGDPTPMVLGGEAHTAEAITAQLLRWVLDRIEEVEGEAPDTVALTHPASWGDYERGLLRAAAVEAGVEADAVTLVAAPRAAALYHASREPVPDDAIVAVYDLGGGTFDAAVLRKREGGEFELLGPPEGIERTGGLDFDALVLDHVNAALDGAVDALATNESLVVPALINVRQECVDAKEALSSDPDVTVTVVLPEARREVRLLRHEFEDMIRPAIAETIDTLERALVGAGVSAEDVHTVLLVGGSSRIPLVAEMIATALDRPVAVDAHPKHAVALGAAIEAAGHAGAGEISAITATVDGVEPPVTARIPIVVPPPPPPPSDAVRRVIMPEEASPPARRPPVWVLAAIAVAAVLLVAVLITRRDSGSGVQTAASDAVPAATDPAGLQPGPPPGSQDPAAPADASPVVAIRHGDHTGFERIAVDFADPLPPRIRSVESDASLGRVRVFFDEPRPTEAAGAARLDVDSTMVRSVFFVVDAEQSYVDIYTKQLVDPLAFRLGDVAFKDGTSKGVAVIDLVPSSSTGSCCDVGALGSGGAFVATQQGGTVHVEGYGERASGKGVVRVVDHGGAEVRSDTVSLTARSPVNGVFRVDVDVAGLSPGQYTLVFTSDDARDDVGGQPPATTQVLTLG